MKVLRVARRSEVNSLAMLAAIQRTKPFVVMLLGTSGRASSFAAGSAVEAEEFAVEQLAADDTLFGAVVRCGPSVIVSRVLPG